MIVNGAVVCRMYVCVRVVGEAWHDVAFMPALGRAWCVLRDCV